MAWGLFILYLIATTYLGYLGSTKTQDFKSFAIGNGDMSPWVVGITLAASTASAATFIINPGFVYVHGLAAFMHLGISVFIGILFMLFLSSYRFRKIGNDVNAVTIPSWVGNRYRSRSFAIYFSIISMLSFAFMVLLVGGISIVMQQLLGIGHITALSITLIFVTGYVILGGTYAHVFTNVLQGGLMIIISLIIVSGGFYLMYSSPDFWDQVASIDVNLIGYVNPDSNLFGDFFSVYISGFLIGMALVCQPHILTKALYVKDNQAITKYLTIFSLTYFLFTLLLLAGFWALIEVPSDLLLDSTTGEFRQDLVMTKYLSTAFPDWLFVIISVVLLAAAMSTLDGLLIGIATIASNDFIINVFYPNKDSDRVDSTTYKKALRSSHIVLIVLAIATFVVSINPPRLLGIFGQFGVYALVLSSLPPILIGVFFKRPSLTIAWVASVIALLTYIVIYFWGSQLLPNTNLSLANPAVPASISIIISTVPALIISQLTKSNISDA